MGAEASHEKLPGQAILKNFASRGMLTYIRLAGILKYCYPHILFLNESILFDN